MGDFWTFVRIFLIINGRFVPYTWRNDWRRHDNASTTFWDRSDRNPDWMTFGWNFGVGGGLRSPSALVINVKISLHMR